MPILARNIGTYNGTGQGIFQDLERGGVNQPLGVPSLPFSSPLPFPLPLLPLSPSFLPEAGGCCAKVGGINPSEGVWEIPWDSQQDYGT